MENLAETIRKFPRIKYNYISIDGVLYITTSLDEISLMLGIYCFIQGKANDVKKFSIRVCDRKITEKIKTFNAVFAYVEISGNQRVLDAKQQNTATPTPVVKLKFVSIHLINDNYKSTDLVGVVNSIRTEVHQAYSELKELWLPDGRHKYW